MKILVLGLNYAPEKIGIAVYTSGLAETLAQAGHAVSVIAGRPYYPGWKLMDGESALAFGHGVENGVQILRVPHYIPRNPSGYRRVLHHFSFALAALFPMVWRCLTMRPDVVLTIAPSMIAAPVARFAAALVGAASWLHVQDFEVEAAVATKLLKQNSWSVAVARWFERVALASFDAVSAISPQMCRKLTQKGVPANRIVELRNWADIDEIRPEAGGMSYRRQWSIITPHVALYAGNIGNKQGIEIIVDAARRLRHRKDLTFVICGEGPNRRRLEQRASGLDNIRFYDLQPKERLGELLGLATVHLLPQLADAADLVLPSKLANMLASGRPIVATAHADTGLAAEVADCGVLAVPEDADSFADAIVAVIDSPDRVAMGVRARSRAERRWQAGAILAEAEAVMCERVGAAGNHCVRPALP